MSVAFDIDRYIAENRHELREELARRMRPLDMVPQRVPTKIDLSELLATYVGLEGDTKADADGIKGALRFFLGHDVVHPGELTLANEVFERLTMPAQVAVYWWELDMLRRNVKTAAFVMTRRCIRRILDAWTDYPSASQSLRQLIEITWWSLYCTFGAQLALMSVREVIKNGERAGDFRSPDAENFIRGFFAPDPERLAAGFRASGEQRGPHDSEIVDENAALILKQRSVARFFAEQYGRMRNVRLTSYADRLVDAYHYACGWVHVTPLLVLHALGDDEGATLPAMHALARNVMVSVWELQRHLLFDPLWRREAFVAAILPAVLPKSDRRIMIQLDVVERLRHRDKPVEITLADGTRVGPYPRRS